jgi:hypothetical protein
MLDAAEAESEKAGFLTVEQVEQELDAVIEAAARAKG